MFDMRASVTIHPIWVFTEFDNRKFGPLIAKVRKLKAAHYPIEIIDTRSCGVYVRDPENGEVYFLEYYYLNVAGDFLEVPRHTQVIAF